MQLHGFTQSLTKILREIFCFCETEVILTYLGFKQAETSISLGS